MDPAEHNFQQLLVEQAALHVERLPAFEGIAVDRLDYSEYYNLDADDGVCWVPCPPNGANCRSKSAETEASSSAGAGGNWTGGFGPARSLRLSYRDTFRRIGKEVLHKDNAARVMAMNCNVLCRIDQIESFDLTFSEGSSLNGVAWTGLAMPTILWTYSLSGKSDASLDAFFQQHLLMNVFPSAPMPKNGNQTHLLRCRVLAARDADSFFHQIT